MDVFIEQVAAMPGKRSCDKLGFLVAKSFAPWLSVPLLVLSLGMPTEGSAATARTGAQKTESSRDAQRLKNEIQALRKQHDSQLTTLREESKKEIQAAVAQEAAAREKEFKRLEDKKEPYEIVKIVLPTVAILLSLFVWWEGHKRAKEDRASSLIDDYHDQAMEIGEAKHYLQSTIAAGSRQHGHVVRIGNFFNRVASAALTGRANRKVLDEELGAEATDYWERAQKSQIDEIRYWAALKEFAEQRKKGGVST